MTQLHLFLPPSKCFGNLALKIPICSSRNNYMQFSCSQTPINLIKYVHTICLVAVDLLGMYFNMQNQSCYLSSFEFCNANNAHQQWWSKWMNNVQHPPAPLKCIIFIFSDSSAPPALQTNIQLAQKYRLI